jgi:hypothetical protein
VLFVLGGALCDVASGELLDRHSAFRVDPSDTGRAVETVEDCQLFFVLLPNFEPAN